VKRVSLLVCRQPLTCGVPIPAVYQVVFSRMVGELDREAWDA